MRNLGALGIVYTVRPILAPETCNQNMMRVVARRCRHDTVATLVATAKQKAFVVTFMGIFAEDGANSVESSPTEIQSYDQRGEPSCSRSDSQGCCHDSHLQVHG